VNLLSLLGEAGKSLSRHPLRSLLTALSVTFGAAVLIVLVSYGTAAPEAAVEVLRQTASTQILVYPRWTRGHGGGRTGRQIRIRYDDIPALKEACPSIVGLAGAFWPTHGAPAFSADRSWPWVACYGVGYDYKKVADVRVVAGRWFTRFEETGRERVALLNRPLAEGLFGDVNPLGQWIDFKSHRFQVIGVFENENTYAYGLYVPYASAMDLGDRDGRYVGWLALKPLRPDLAADAVQEIRDALSATCGFDADDPTALSIRENTAFNQKIEGASLALEVLILTIAGVALVLGCLGAANVVGIAVSERTAELGLRKALGATPARVRAEVLAETLILCLAGGLAGVLLGETAIAALGPLQLTDFVRLIPRADFQFLAAGFTILVLAGTLSGIPAAARASRLDPAVALRDE